MSNDEKGSLDAFDTFQAKNIELQDGGEGFTDLDETNSLLHTAATALCRCVEWNTEKTITEWGEINKGFVENISKTTAFLIRSTENEEKLEQILAKNRNADGKTVMQLLVEPAENKALRERKEDALRQFQKTVIDILAGDAKFEKHKDIFRSCLESVGKSLPEGMNWHFFLSHFQGNAGDQCGQLYELFEGKHWKVWYDQRMEGLTTQHMMDGVEQSEVFVLFLSENVFTRPYCRLEIEHAMRSKKPIITIFEDDSRHGKFDFAEARKFENVPEEFRPLAEQIMDHVEAMPFRRRKWEQDPMLQEIERRYGARYTAGKEFYEKSDSKEGEPTATTVEGGLELWGTQIEN